MIVIIEGQNLLNIFCFPGRRDFFEEENDSLKSEFFHITQIPPPPKKTP